MAKTSLTKELEYKLYYETKSYGLGVYGCYEVCVGEGYGVEYIDYATMDSKENFRCYEIKVSKSDFYSKARKTFIGNFNYLVMPHELYEELLNDECDDKKIHIKHYINNGIGILSYKPCRNGIQKFLYYTKKAKRKELSVSNKAILMHSFIRSMSRNTKPVEYKENNDD